MQLSTTDSILWLAGDAGNILVLVILLGRRLHRMFPIFTAFVVYAIASDVVGYSVVGHVSYATYFKVYFTLNVLQTLLGFGVLFEIAANILRPVMKSMPAAALGIFAVIVLLGGGVTWVLSGHASQVALTVAGRAFVRVNVVSAILSVVVFSAIALFAQVLGIGWKNHILQLASGLAFYSAIGLLVELMQNHLVPSAGAEYGNQYHNLAQLRAISYVCTTAFWSWSFAKKEAPRKEFSPQMANFLVSISDTAKRNRAALARTGPK
jgi:hypothetical protein